ncbi:bifunctional DNA primase/polymerase [Gordonia sp. NPDC058843]|uniref:bifunctional DNA primase/polymerase n=1 Tax=Gordonia sp. NPDC058843 TaxID=3346648 RepID=UPI00368E2405
MFAPRVPDVSGLSLRETALAYAEAGLYVLPLAPGTKVPHRGVNYSTDSSCDPAQITEWWDENPDFGIGLHMKRSRLVAFDLDSATLAQLPPEMAEGLRAGLVQRSRRAGGDNPDRGHYVFFDDFGASNAAGAFGSFGEVRGGNAYIVVEPTPHTKPDGEYRWLQTGDVPDLPAVLRACLSQASSKEVPPLSHEELQAFLDDPAHCHADSPGRMKGPLEAFVNGVVGGASIHEMTPKTLCWLFRESRGGAYPAVEAMVALQTEFLNAFASRSGGAGERTAPGFNEFQRAAAWAAAQVKDDDPDELRQRMDRDALTGDLDADVERELGKLRVRDRAKAAYAEEKARDRLMVNADRAMDGLAFLTEAVDETPLWGEGDRTLWAPGEGLMICGPQGVGKSTIVQQLMLARLGLTDPEFCGLPVVVDERPILYLAMDRPPQIRRSINRMVNTADENVAAVLKRQLVVWKGPPPVNAAEAPEVFAKWVAMHGRDPGLVIVDSLKDLASGLGEDAVGSGINTAMQTVLANGTEFIDLHHQRKATADNRKPDKLADVFGSTWLTSGMGSVVLVWGEAGAPTVELSHLKQPAAPVGPLIVNHSHGQGLSSANDLGVMLMQLAVQAGAVGITEKDAVAGVFQLEEHDTDYAPAKKRVRRRLDKFTREGQLTYTPGAKGGSGGGGRPATWVVV